MHPVLSRGSVRDGLRALVGGDLGGGTWSRDVDHEITKTLSRDIQLLTNIAIRHMTSVTRSAYIIAPSRFLVHRPAYVLSRPRRRSCLRHLRSAIDSSAVSSLGAPIRLRPKPQAATARPKGPYRAKGATARISNDSFLARNIERHCLERLCHQRVSLGLQTASREQ